MGFTFSCPLAFHFDLENGLQTIFEKTVDVENDEQPHCAPLLDHKQEEAAIKLQKVYKSFRTRRKLADCAVLVEHSWWKLLDFAELKHSSVSFFGLYKHESAVSRWARAITRAAKVGKGLSKNGKARKLALPHWLEAIDHRHRYGHNLHFYYVNWLSSQCKEPFFYWLDIGEGKEVNLTDKCPRLKLQQQCIKYLGPLIERRAYEVVIENGKLLYKQTGELLDTTKEPKGSKWIFVLSTCNTLYVGKKTKGSFQHSSFLAGGAAVAAGRLVAEKGVLKATSAHSGHYRPTPESFADFLSFLNEHNVDLTDVKLDPIDEDDEESMGMKGGSHMRSSGSEGNLAEEDWWTLENESQSSSNETTTPEDDSAILLMSSTLHKITRKLSVLDIPSNKGLLKKVMDENERISESRPDSFYPESPREGHETEEDSDQKGKHIASNWSTGAGARISCLRDYPQGLQYQALERLLNLSPRNKPQTRLNNSAGTGSGLSSLTKLIL